MNRQTHLLSKATFAQNTRYNNRYRQMRIDRVTLGYDLRLERLRQGLTQEQVGVLSDLSAGTIRRAEKYGLVSVRAFYLITNALGKQLTIK